MRATDAQDMCFNTSSLAQHAYLLFFFFSFEDATLPTILALFLDTCTAVIVALTACAVVPAHVGCCIVRSGRVPSWYRRSVSLPARTKEIGQMMGEKKTNRTDPLIPCELAQILGVSPFLERGWGLGGDFPAADSILWTFSQSRSGPYWARISSIQRKRFSFLFSIILASLGVTVSSHPGPRLMSLFSIAEMSKSGHSASPEAADWKRVCWCWAKDGKKEAIARGIVAAKRREARTVGIEGNIMITASGRTEILTCRVVERLWMLGSVNVRNS